MEDMEVLMTLDAVAVAAEALVAVDLQEALIFFRFVNNRLTQ